MTLKIARSSNVDEARINQLRSRLKAFFWRAGSSPSDAEDFAQDVLLRIGTAAHGSPLQSDSYVFTVARNLQRDRARRTRVRHKHGSHADEDIYPLIHVGNDAVDAERVLVSKEQADLLVAGLAELSERVREIFLMYRLDGRPQREIAAELGISVSAVEKSVAKAMLYLVKKVNWE